MWAGTEHLVHHGLAATSWGTVMTLQTETVDLDYLPRKSCPVYGDRIVEITFLMNDHATGDVIAVKQVLEGKALVPDPGFFDQGLGLARNCGQERGD